MFSKKINRKKFFVSISTMTFSFAFLKQLPFSKLLNINKSKIVVTPNPNAIKR